MRKQADQQLNLSETGDITFLMTLDSFMYQWLILASNVLIVPQVCSVDQNLRTFLASLKSSPTSLLPFMNSDLE